MNQFIENLKPDEILTLKLRRLFEQFGYKKYRMGRFEEYSLYAANRNFLTGDRILTFTDLDGKLLALKPDVTLSIVKNTKADRRNKEKLYYIENVYRESKESHTYQEISQMGLECLGCVDEYTILEVLYLAEQSLQAVGHPFLLTLSHMGFVVGLLSQLPVEENKKEKLLSCIRSKNSSGLEEVMRPLGLPEAEARVLRALPKLYGNFSSVMKEAAKLALNQEMEQALYQLGTLYDGMKQHGMTRKLWLDFSMINDTDYYNGIVFQGFVDGLPRSILAGGQYDHMTRKLGKEADAIGFALYLNELRRLPQKSRDVDVDALILVRDKEEPGRVLAEVRMLMKRGLSVRVEREIPEDIRYGALYYFAGGTLSPAGAEDGTC